MKIVLNNHFITPKIHYLYYPCDSIIYDFYIGGKCFCSQSKHWTYAFYINIFTLISFSISAYYINLCCNQYRIRKKISEEKKYPDFYKLLRENENRFK